MSKLKSEINNSDNQSLVLEEGAASLNDIYDKAFIGGQEGVWDYDNNNKNDEKMAIDDNKLSPLVQELSDAWGFYNFTWKGHIKPRLEELKSVQTTADIRFLADMYKIVGLFGVERGEEGLKDEILALIENAVPNNKKKQFEEEELKPSSYLSDVSFEESSQKEID